MLFSHGLKKYKHKMILMESCGAKLFVIDVFKAQNSVEYAFAIDLRDEVAVGTLSFLYQLPNGNLTDEVRWFDSLLQYELITNYVNWADIMIKQVAIKNGCNEKNAQRVQDTMFRLMSAHDQMKGQ